MSLRAAISDYKGYAIILERDSGYLVANSMKLDNFKMKEDGSLERYKIENLPDSDIKAAYDQYMNDGKGSFLYHGEKENLFIDVKEVSLSGLDWMVISAVPEDYLLGPAAENILWTLFLGTVFTLIFTLTYIFITRRLLEPVKDLLLTADALSKGELDRRVQVGRNDEIGRISESLNKVADELQQLVTNLESKVVLRTKLLQEANQTLQNNQEQLQLILDSAAEAIYGIDLEGRCTFCNISCLDLLGYNDQSELLGRNMHNLLHHSYKPGRPISAENCKISRAVIEGVGTHSDDEVFLRADGTYINVEYYSYPKIHNGVVTGAVITFMDISDRKKKEEKIKYLSYHDTLTGLYNRRSFEEYSNSLDREDKLPLAIIFADINGLKMTNDIFGHVAGDELITKSAEILKSSCRQDDIIARVGGDEFMILLPDTSRREAEMLVERIKAGFQNARVRAIKCSFALGLDVKTDMEQDLDEVVSKAEDEMYKEKTLNRKATSKDMLDALIDTLHERSPLEKEHSKSVAELSTKLGAYIGLPTDELAKLTQAAYLHDLGKIITTEKTNTDGKPGKAGTEVIRQHTVTGYRIQNLFDETVGIAEYVYSHHEKWDGLGYPRGLKAEEIPLLSRIMGLVEAYDRIRKREGFAKAVEVIGLERGKSFDPELTDTFITMLENENIE